MQKNDAILDLDATAVMEQYEKGTLKPSQAVEAYIAHQKRFNSKLNLVVENRYDEARQEAAKCDAMLAEGKTQGRLFGVPMSIKESYNVAGMHTTGAIKNNADRLISVDSGVTRRLKAEGAIIMNKTNTPGLCFCQETDNNLFGRSNNPWNPANTTGGSSGGEAALMAVGGAAAGFGSDIGGSIRIPSHFNGVVGFKPGAFKFPDDGHYGPETPIHQKPMLGYGPIVKSVRDAALLYSCIYPQFQPPKTWRLPKELRIFSFSDFGKTHCTPETIETLSAAQKKLREKGAVLHTKPPAFMKGVSEAWQLIMSEDHGESVIEEAYPGRPNACVLDYLKAKAGLESEQHPYLSWAILGTRLFPPSEAGLRKTLDFIERGIKRIDTLLSDNGVFVIPAYPSPAKPHGQVYGEIFSITLSFKKVMPFTALANVFGLPAIIVPCGKSKEGLPIGLQIVANQNNEELLFKVAAFLEKSFGGYKRCNSYDK